MKRSRKNKKRVKKRCQQSGSSGGGLELGAAAEYPVFESLVRKDWRNGNVLTEVIVSKKPPFGGVVSCMFLVDLACLGPKQGFVTQFRTFQQYKREFRSLVTAQAPMVSVDFPLAAKILQESISYAYKLGFTFPEGVQGALRALGPLEEADKCQEEIPCGDKNGRPHYMAGPDDDVDQIMNTLDASCGRGNYDFTIPQQGFMPPGFFD